MRSQPVRCLVLLAALGVTAPWLADAAQPKAKGPVKPVAAIYEFSPKLPGYCTARLTFRNARKLRPLFLVGRGHKGQLAFTPADLGTLEKAGDAVDLAGLVEWATSTGSFQMNYSNFSGGACPAECDRFTCGDWLRPENKPQVLFEVSQVLDWMPAEKKRRGDDTANRYDVRVKGKLLVGDRELAVSFPASAQVQDGSLGTEPSVRFRGQFKIKGSDMGLTGDDAGEISALIAFAGFTRMGKESEALLHKAITDVTERDASAVHRAKEEEGAGKSGASTPYDMIPLKGD